VYDGAVVCDWRISSVWYQAATGAPVQRNDMAAATINNGNGGNVWRGVAAAWQ